MISKFAVAAALFFAGLAVAEESELPPTLTLAQAEALLERNNLTVIAARYGVDGARAARLIASYTPNPTLTIGAEQIKTDRKLKSYVDDSGTASDPQYTFRIDRLLETAHKKSLRTAAAEFAVAANEAQLLDAIRTQKLQLKQSFYSALLARENAVNAKDILESVNGTENLMTKLSKQGNLAEIDLIKFQASKIQYERDAENAVIAREQSLRDLANLLAAKLPIDKNPDAPSKLELQGTLDTPALELNIDDLLARVDERPDVIAAQQSLASAEKNVALARAQRWSDVTVGGEYQRVGSDNTVGVVVSVPLPLYNNHRGNIDQAEALRDAACAALKKTRLQVRADIDKAYRTYISGRKILALYQANTIAKSKDALDVMRKSYEIKNATLLDVLDAERTYKATLQAVNQARYDLLNSLLTLESAADTQLIK